MLSRLLRFNRRLLAFGHDIVVAALSFVFALYLRLGPNFINTISPEVLITSLLLFTFTCAIVFMACGLYRGIWAFASIHDLGNILRAVSISVVLFTLIGFLFTRLEGVPRTTPLITWFILLAGLGGSRLALRIWRENRLNLIWQKAGGGRVNVLVAGAGDETDLFIRALSSNPQAPFRVVGVLGENNKRVGRLIHGVEVLGTVDDLPKIIETLRRRDRAPSRVILTHSVARGNVALVGKLLEVLPALGLSLSQLPSMTELRNDVTAVTEMRDQPIALEDLLGRPELVLQRNQITQLAQGRRVLVTGAGGTIGSELARQIAALQPAHLTLIEFSEHNLYRIELEMREKLPMLSLRGLIADVRDAERLQQIFAMERPEIVFHAAAIKHVPIAEDNAREAILTNVMGTRLIADCAAKIGALAMVQISTDKAVHPANVMGATKRLAEMYCQALDLASSTTRFITVRFGNVLGSNGSVVPRFREQLEKGGPITVTHPDITRYFMTVREAVELVLQAATFGMHQDEQRGKVLVLDMGQPVKIADLARQMIRLAGLRPDEDIKIIYTGLRPGEKLHEELFTQEEELACTSADGVRIAKARTLPLLDLQRLLGEFSVQLRAGVEEPVAIAKLAALVPEFKRAGDQTDQSLPQSQRLKLVHPL